jgi:hypothetical protein
MPAEGRREVNRTDPATVSDQAARVVVSFRSPEVEPDTLEAWPLSDSDWLAEQMDAPSYRRYLRWAHAGPVEVGDEWDEFVNCGCSSPEDVVLRVEEIHDGENIGSETTIEVVPLKGYLDRTQP